VHHSVQGFHQAVCDVADRFRREHLETLEHLLSGADHDDNEMDGGGSAVIEDRYYSKAEYGKMSQGDKKLLWDRHQKRGGQDGQEKERPLKRSKTATVASLNRKVAALEKKMASKDEDKSANDNESVDQDESSGGGGNRTNRALTRQQAKKK
jgi:hypothetical protein